VQALAHAFDVVLQLSPGPSIAASSPKPIPQLGFHFGVYPLLRRSESQRGILKGLVLADALLHSPGRGCRASDESAAGREPHYGDVMVSTQMQGLGGHLAEAVDQDRIDLLDRETLRAVFGLHHQGLAAARDRSPRSDHVK